MMEHDTDTILVVEDEPILLETLSYNLTHQGYKVHTAQDGYSGLDSARQTKPDLIVLDIMLPGIDGLEVCRILRHETSVPIIILTARDDEIDRVIGLELGADDYITKPFSMREFVARVKAHLRRVRFDQPDKTNTSDGQGRVIKHGNLEIDLLRREARLSGKPLVLKPKEYELLLFLARHPGQLLSRELILQRVWGWEFTGGSRTVDVHVRWLRQKIEDDPNQAMRITTVRGAGYRFDG